MKTYHHSVCQKVFYRTWLGLTQCHQRSLIFIFWSFFYHSQPLRQRDLWKMFATCSQSNVTCGSLDFIRLLYWFWTNNATKQENHERHINIPIASYNCVHSLKRRKSEKTKPQSNATPASLDCITLLQLWTNNNAHWSKRRRQKDKQHRPLIY